MTSTFRYHIVDLTEGIAGTHKNPLSGNGDKLYAALKTLFGVLAMFDRLSARCEELVDALELQLDEIFNVLVEEFNLIERLGEFAHVLDELEQDPYALGGAIGVAIEFGECDCE